MECLRTVFSIEKFHCSATCTISEYKYTSAKNPCSAEEFLLLIVCFGSGGVFGDWRRVWWVNRRMCVIGEC